jgi:hypothetical protein
MFQARYGLLGHVLRMHNEIPAKQAMLYFFQKHTEKGYRGRPRTTLATQIGHDLQKIQETASQKSTRASWLNCLPKTLSTLADLLKLEALARNRKVWQQIRIDTHALLYERGKQAEKQYVSPSFTVVK